MRFVLPLMAIAAAASAQTISVTSPASGAIISGTSFQLTVAYSNLAGAYSVEYDVDGETVGITRIPAYSFLWNPYYTGNGKHTINAIARDIFNNVLATSTVVPFQVENDLPQHTCPPNGAVCSDISVNSGPAPQMTLSVTPTWNANAITLKTTATAVVSQFAAIRSVTSPGTSLSTAAAADSAGQALAIFAQWANPSNTIAVTDLEGNAYSCGNVNSGANGLVNQWCVAPNAAGSSNNVIKVTYSSSETSFATLYSLKITNVAHSSPIDIRLSTSGSGSNSVASQPLFATQPNEVVLFGGSWNSVHVTATAGSGYTVTNDPTNGTSAIEYAIAPGSNWFGSWGFTVSANGDNAAQSKSIFAFVDGKQVVSTSGFTTTATSFNVDTSKFLNGSHAIVVTETGPNCPGCANAFWNYMGQWEQYATFTNPSVAMELRASAREVTLCTAAQAGCPTSATLTGTIYNTDGTSSAATISSCVSNNTAVLTISGTCTVNHAGLGVDFLTMTASNGMTRQVWTFVNTINVLPHFGTDGSILAAYDPARSFWHASLFFSNAVFSQSTAGMQTATNPASVYGPAFARAGFNTIEWSFRSSSGYTSQAAFESDTNADIATVTGNLAAYGLGKLKYIHLIGDAWWFGTPQLFSVVYGAGATWSPPALQDSLARWVSSGRVVGHTGKDEVGLAWGGNPLEATNTGGLIIGANGFTQVTGNGSTCSLAWTAPNNDMFTGAHNFIITGSGQSALDYSAAANSPLFHGTTVGNAVNFSCTFSGTISSGTTQVHPYVAWTYDAAGNACPPGGSSAGPCTQWIHYDALKQTRTWITNVANFPKVTFPLANGCCSYGIQNWSGASAVGGVKMGDYWENYWTPGSGVYLATNLNMTDVISSLGDKLRSQALAYMDRTTPLISESAGTIVDYLFQGFQLPVSSCTGNTITTAAPHGLYNVVPEMTKLWVTGSANGACDGNYFVLAAPTANTITVALANATFSTSGIGGIIRFQDGSTFTASSINPSNTGNGPGGFDSTVNSSCPNTWKNKRGQTFTVTGNTNANINSMTGFFDWLTLDVCSGLGTGGGSYWRQIPNLSSTGGTATILPDLWYRRGISWPVNGETGPRYPFAALNEIAIERGAGHRAYSFQTDPQYFDRTTVGVNNVLSNNIELIFSPMDFNGAVQAGLNPVADFAKSQIVTQAHAIANLIHERLTKYEFQPVLNSPDYGPFYEAAARTGAFGNLLEIQYFGEAPVSCTANLAPYLTGQPIIRISATWASIEPIQVIASANTDTMTCQPGEYRAYIFAKNEAVELMQPTISNRLADVANAAKIVVQFSYSLLAFTSQSVAAQVFYQTFDCGTGTCVLPVDSNIGPVYYRLQYLDANGNILRTGDLQTL